MHDDDKTNATKREFYEQKIKQIDDKMSRAQLTEDTKFKVKFTPSYFNLKLFSLANEGLNFEAD